MGFPGLPLLVGFPCGLLPPVETGLSELPIIVTSGKVTCEEALAVAKVYLEKSQAEGARAVAFDSWQCGINTGSGDDSAQSNLFCQRNEDSLTIGPATIGAAAS